VVVSAAVFVAMGIGEHGRRSILGVSVGTSEAEVHWREFLESLQLRGLRGVKLITSDSHSGLKAAIGATFPGTAWQRCQFHLQRNAVHHVSKVALRGEVANCIRRVFAATDEVEARGLIEDAVRKYESSEPKLSAWMAENLFESLAVLQVPVAHRKRLRTSNSVERLNREIKRRTKVASIFPNTESLLRLVTALAIEVSEDWETGRIYLTMEPR